MSRYGVFDILGPVMIGPSSSHTAGAARLGLMARRILGDAPRRIALLLHGSFAATYKGHGTDLALIGGCLGFAPDDRRIRDARKIAAESGIQVEVVTADLGDVHPNTARILLEDLQGRRVEVTGASTGGGNILITEVDGFPLELSGSYYALVTQHIDRPGVVAAVAGILADHWVNIAFMRLSRREKGTIALMVVETDQAIDEKALEAIRGCEGIQAVRMLPPI
ncbi:MAG: L-serine ammonia-lyase, iron-sulfur-dependent subunit beta [Syntrophothermus sp.]